MSISQVHPRSCQVPLPLSLLKHQTFPCYDRRIPPPALIKSTGKQNVVKQLKRVRHRLHRQGGAAVLHESLGATTICALPLLRSGVFARPRRRVAHAAWMGPVSLSTRRTQLTLNLLTNYSHKSKPALLPFFR